MKIQHTGRYDNHHRLSIGFSCN